MKIRLQFNINHSQHEIDILFFLWFSFILNIFIYITVIPYIKTEDGKLDDARK